MPSDHYEILGVPNDADPVLIKRRYRLMVRQNHPDAVTPDKRQSAHEQMLLINAAWMILSDPSERARYDKSRQLVVVPRHHETPPPAHGVRTRVDGWVGGASASSASVSGASDTTSKTGVSGAARAASARAAAARTANGPRYAPRAASSTRNDGSANGTADGTANGSPGGTTGGTRSATRVGNPRTRLLTMVFEAA